MPEARIGVFGGSFNPIHVGHIRAGIEVAEALALDGVEFVPSARPPHKAGEPMLDFALRLTLCRLAVAGIPGFSANALEADRPGPSYTCDTLAALSRLRSGVAWYFIMGMVDLPNLPMWKNGLELGCLANLVVHAREGLALELFSGFMAENAAAMQAEATEDPTVWRLPAGHRMIFVPITRLDISASDVRRRWREGRRIDGLVPEGVLRELRSCEASLRQCWMPQAAGTER